MAAMTTTMLKASLRVFVTGKVVSKESSKLKVAETLMVQRKERLMSMAALTQKVQMMGRMILMVPWRERRKRRESARHLVLAMETWNNWEPSSRRSHRMNLPPLSR